MSIQYLTSAAAYGTGSGSAATTGINTSGASLLVAIVTTLTGNPGVTDSLSNTWYGVAQYGSGPYITIFYASPNSSQVGANHTFTVSAGGFDAGISISTFSGVNPYPSALDQYTGNYNSSVQSLNTGAITPSINNELCITGCGWSLSSQTVSVNNGYTITEQGQSTTVGNASAYLIQTTAATAAATWSGLASAAAMAVTVATFYENPITPLSLTISDNFNFSDSILLLLNLPYSITDSQISNWADTLTPVSPGLTVTLTDNQGVNWADTYLGIGFGIFDGLSLIDSPLGIGIGFNDYLSLSDNPGEIAAVPSLSAFVDNLELNYADVIYIALAIPLIVVDANTLSDTISVQNAVNLQEILNDQFTFSDATVPHLNQPLGYNSDSLNIVDSIQTFAAFLPSSYNDQLTLSDVVGLLYLVNNTNNEQFSFSDAVSTSLLSIFTPVNLNFIDDLTLLDLSSNVFSKESMTQTDSFYFEDGVTIALITDLLPYLRRYLNDVICQGNP